MDAQLPQPASRPRKRCGALKEEEVGGAKESRSGEERLIVEDGLESRRESGDIRVTPREKISLRILVFFARDAGHQLVPLRLLSRAAPSVVYGPFSLDIRRPPSR